MLSVPPPYTRRVHEGDTMTHTLATILVIEVGILALLAVVGQFRP
jgi:hypothetical protein